MLFRVPTFTPEVPIVANTIQALATGVYFATFILCIRWLAFSDNGWTLRKDIKRPGPFIMLIITILLFALAVADLAFTLRSTLLASRLLHSPLYMDAITDFIETLAPIITDSVMIFRCWTVYQGTYNRPWRIIVLPALLVLYNIATLLMVVYWVSTNPLTSTGTPSNQIVATWASFYVSTIIINVYVTSTIILQIWRDSLSLRRFRFTIRVITESGLLYTLTSIATLGACLDFRRSQGPLAIASAINFPVSGIAYNLILIRVAQNRAKNEEQTSTFIDDSTLIKGNHLWKTGSIPSELVV